MDPGALSGPDGCDGRVVKALDLNTMTVKVIQWDLPAQVRTLLAANTFHVLDIFHTTLYYISLVWFAILPSLQAMNQQLALEADA